MRKNGGKLKPKLVTAITASFMIVSTLVSSIAIVNNSINVKKIEETRANLAKAMEEETDPTANWDLSKVWVYTDPDGVKVPVPIGWTVSGVESERYVNHNVIKTGTLTDLTFSSTGEYPWTQNEDNVWVSGNYNEHNTTSELVSDEIIVGEDGGYLSIEWSVSSERNDYLLITIINIDLGTTEIQISVSGSDLGTNYNSLLYKQYNIELEEGKYTIDIQYKKSSSKNGGLDRGYVKKGIIINYNNAGEDETTIHKRRSGDI